MAKQHFAILSYLQNLQKFGACEKYVFHSMQIDILLLLLAGSVLFTTNSTTTSACFGSETGPVTECLTDP